MKSSRKRPRPLWNYPTGPLDSLDFVFKLSYKSESCLHIIQNFDETAVFDSGKNWTQRLAVCIKAYIKILIKQYFLLFFLYAQLLSEALVRNNPLLLYHAIAYETVVGNFRQTTSPPSPPPPPKKT